MTKPSGVTPGPWYWNGGHLGSISVFGDEIVLWPGNVVGLDDEPISKQNFRKWWRDRLGSCGKTCEYQAPWNAMVLAAAPTMYEWLKKHRATLADGSKEAKEIDAILSKIDVAPPPEEGDSKT